VPLTLRFERVTFSYGQFRPSVLREFTWIIPPGRTVLLGPNGAGKSTLLSLGADAIRPQRGKIQFGQFDPSRSGERSIYRRSIGWMPQEIRAVPGLTVREQVAYAGWLKGLPRKSSWDRTPATLGLVGLQALADRPASSLSGGELRRLGIAQTLVHEAKVLLLDEPTAGLDPAQRARFRELLISIAPQCQIVVSTHQVDDLSELFDTVVVLARGMIRFAGTVASFLQQAPSSSNGRQAEAAYAAVIG